MADAVPDVLDDARAAGGSLPALAQVQIVDENQEFSTDLSDALCHRWQIQDQGLNYNVVAVFGSQSTGKSTLLNNLFETQFDVMDESMRQQTTKGIWASKARGANILVLDVEGTDGRERGENQDFERKSALFSLSVAEVLIVNMWEQSVGLYNGANMGLLKTVFEVNLQLFQKHGSPKTCIFFVLRDFTGRTPLQKLADTLINDLKKIWDSLSKPQGKENAPITDFFDFEYIGIPHRIYATEGFDKAVTQLRARFYPLSDADHVFKPAYHKRIPIDGFPHFAAAIWDKIVNNRDLDLPTQQQLLAQYRCDEIAKAAYEQFMSGVRPLRQKIDIGRVADGLGETAGEMTRHALAAFDKDASRYNTQVYTAKRSEFADQMYTALSVLFVQQLRNLHKLALDTFNDLLATKTRSDDSDFAQKLKASYAEAEALFKSSAEAALIPEAGWTYEEQLTLFTAELDEACARKRSEAMERLAKRLEAEITSSLQDPIANLFSRPTKMLWPDVVRSFNKVIGNVSASLKQSLDGLEVEATVVDQEVKKTKAHTWSVLMDTIKQEITGKHLIEKLRTRFESKFRYDDKGMPRFWSPADDIDGTFATAQAQADELLVQLSAFRVPLTEIDKDVAGLCGIKDMPLTLIPMSKQEEARAEFNREAHSHYVDAKRSIVATTARIPPWFIIMTVILGWNELLAILRNPILTIFLLMSFVIGYGVWRTNMGGPVYQVARATTGEIGRQFTAQLQDHGLSMDRIVHHPVMVQAWDAVEASIRLVMGPGNDTSVVDDDSFELSSRDVGRDTSDGKSESVGVGSAISSPTKRTKAGSGHVSD